MENINEQAIDWHAAFREAIRAELYEYNHLLEYKEEVPLTTEPLRIDLIVIKKQSDIVIKKNIAEIFREYNLIEFKSPDDYISIHDFHKTCSYVYLYMSLHRIDVKDITLTILSNRYPRKLINYFKQLNMLVTEKSAGVYHVASNIFPVQIIESKKLTEQENIWLTNLKRGISAASMQNIIELKRKKYQNITLAAYIYAIIQANPKSIKEMKEDNMADKSLAQIMEELGYTKRWEEKGEARGKAIGEAQGKAKGASYMLNIIKGIKNNIPFEKLAGEYETTVDEIEKIKLEVSL